MVYIFEKFCGSFTARMYADKIISFPNYLGVQHEVISLQVCGKIMKRNAIVNTKTNWINVKVTPKILFVGIDCLTLTIAPFVTASRTPFNNGSTLIRIAKNLVWIVE